MLSFELSTPFSGFLYVSAHPFRVRYAFNSLFGIHTSDVDGCTMTCEAFNSLFGIHWTSQVMGRESLPPLSTPFSGFGRPIRVIRVSTDVLSTPFSGFSSSRPARAVSASPFQLPFRDSDWEIEFDL